MLLVTGCTGFVGSHVVKSLLDAQQPVRGTVRSKANTAKYQFLLDIAAAAAGKLEVCELDLVTSSEDQWDAALQGCIAVIHVAAGTDVNTKNPQRDLMEPTIGGTQRLLDACKRAGIKRLVLTSSISSVSYTLQEKPVFTSEDWNTRASLKHQPYPYCKVQSEKLCMQFCKDNAISLCVIVPAVILGVPLNAQANAVLNEGVIMVLNGKMPIVLNMSSPICDVLDVAKMHRIAAMDPEIEGRYICWSETWSTGKAYDCMFSALPEKFAATRKPSKVRIPNAVFKLIVRATQPRSTADIVASYLGANPLFDVNPALERFNIQGGFIPVKQTLENTAKWAVYGTDLVKPI